MSPLPTDHAGDNLTGPDQGLPDTGNTLANLTREQAIAAAPPEIASVFAGLTDEQFAGLAQVAQAMASGQTAAVAVPAPAPTEAPPAAPAEPEVDPAAIAAAVEALTPAEREALSQALAASAAGIDAATQQVTE